MNRKFVRGLIYVGVFITFPHLPLSGVKVLFELGRGVVSGSKAEVAHEAKNFIFKPFGIVPELFHKFNPFE